MTWFKRFHSSPSRSGLTMLLGLFVALSWSFASFHSYQTLAHGELFSSLRSWGLDSLHGLVQNLLLPFFFFGIGLELSREVRSGKLTRWSSLATPLLGAAGGMLFTAIPLLAIGEFTHTPLLVHGWGIPMATDISLTLGALSLLGSRVPGSLRLFVLTLAILDDVGSVVALGFVRPLALHEWITALLATVVALLAILLWRRGVSFAPWIALTGLWVAFQRLGIEPALAGAVVGVLAPSTRSSVKLEATMSHLSSYLVLPLFTFVATGISWRTDLVHASGGKVLLAIALVRVLGKALGIGIGVRMSERLGGVHSQELHGLVLIGVGLSCAIGFTVPLVFASAVVAVGSTAFGAITASLLIASLVGGVAGSIFLLAGLRPRPVQRGN